MFKYIINGGRILRGDITVSGSKNAVLPILSAAVLNKGITRILNCPDISDVRTTIEILRMLGCRVDFRGGIAVIDASSITCSKIPADQACKCRSSITFLGALISRTGSAEIPYPGGCTIGSRPVNIHESVLSSMGINVKSCESCIRAEAVIRECEKHIYMDFPSVGATENALLAAAGNECTTYIYGAAREPEIVCLAGYLKTIGAEISGEGSGCIKVTGRSTYENEAVDFTVIPDRIETATYLIAAAACGSGVRVCGCIPEHTAPIISTLIRMGCEISHISYQSAHSAVIEVTRGAAHKRLNAPGLIAAGAYPAYPTDAQSLILPLLAIAKGRTAVTDTIFPERFGCAYELSKMGADIKRTHYGVLVNGRKKIKSAYVNSLDLRSGAAMIIAGLAAPGKTIIQDGGYIKRGYENICEKLRGIGAEIWEMPYQNLSYQNLS